MSVEEKIAGLPGNESIRKGLRDFAGGAATLESYLVQIGSSRLKRAGLKLDGAIDPDADYKLYDLLQKKHGSGTHSKYNSWIRQLVSFERALAQRMSARTNG